MAIFSDSIQSEIEQDIVLPPGKDLRISHTGHLEASWVLANGHAIQFYQGFNRSFPVSQAHGLIRLKTFSSPADVTIDDSDGTSTQAAASYTSGGDVTGSPLPGSTLTAAAIIFAGSPTTVRQWWKNGQPTGVTATTYNVTSSNDNIYVIYTATNAGGKILHRSNTLKVTTVTPAPQVLSGGTVSGATTPAAVLTVTDPTWSNAPSATTRTWWKNGASTGITTSTYSTSTDGDNVFVRFTATNAGGTTSYDSGHVAVSAPIVVSAPVRSSGGSISGATTPAAVLTASAPTYTNSPTSIVGTWFKNGTTTGITTSTYSSTVDGDTIFVRFVATNSGGSSAPFDTGTITVAAVVAPASRQMPVFVTSDIDPANERDDEAAIAMLLATQDHFNITGLSASSPDGVEEGFWQMLTPYGLDRPKLVSHTLHPERFKSESALRALVYNSSGSSSTPVEGYYTTQNEYYKIHAAAQAMIAAASAYGNPTSSDPYDKLWVWVLGGFNTLAQAMYEAVQLGQLSDFCKRIKVVGQPNFNSYTDTNSWAYIFNNCWPSSGTPGMFGDLWMLTGYLQWQDLNDTASPATTVWNELIAEGAMGAFMEQERIAGDHTGLTFRAGDAGAWLWSISAKLQNNFDPTNASNSAGAYKHYSGVLWAAQTFGYGAGSGQGTSTPSPQGTTYSTTLFAPNIPLGHCDLTAWYSFVREAFNRYNAARSVSNPATRTLEETGTYLRTWTLDPPATPVVATVANTWKLHFKGGSAITTPVTVSLSDGTTVSVTSSSTSPVDVTRTVTTAGAYTLSISTVSDSGRIASATPVTVKASNYYTLSQYLVAEYLLNEGSGQVINDSSPNASHGTLGLTSGVEASDPAWLSTGLDIGSGQYALVPTATAAMNINDMTLVMVVKPDSITGVLQLATRDQGTGSRHWQLFQDTSRIKLSAFNATTFTTIQTSTGTVAIGTWVMITARIQANGKMFLSINGVKQGLGAYMAAGPMRNSSPHLLRLGARVNSSAAIVETYDGQIAYFAWYGATDLELKSTIETRARTIATGKGITLP